MSAVCVYVCAGSMVRCCEAAEEVVSAKRGVYGGLASQECAAIPASTASPPGRGQRPVHSFSYTRRSSAGKRRSIALRLPVRVANKVVMQQLQGTVRLVSLEQLE
jgi:hypothetical protein